MFTVCNSVQNFDVSEKPTVDLQGTISETGPTLIIHCSASVTHAFPALRQ